VTPASDDGAAPAVLIEGLATVERLGRAVIVSITRRDLLGEEAMHITAELLGRYEGAAMHFVLDLRRVNYLDSACIGAFVELLTSAQQRGGRVALASCDQGVATLFRLTRLERVLPCYRSVPDAIDAVERGG